MKTRTILSAIICLLLIESAFVPEAFGKKKKRRPKNKDKVEAVEETSSENGDEALEEADTEVEEEASDEAAGEAESKSISEQLTEGEGDGGMRRSNRMEFDERLVKGQAAKSGAVYLFKRVPRHLPGLVPMRRSYRRRIVQPVLGERELKPARYSFEVETELKLKRQKIELETGAPPVTENVPPAAGVSAPSEEETAEKPVEAPAEEKEKAREKERDRGKKRRKK